MGIPAKDWLENLRSEGETWSGWSDDFKRRYNTMFPSQSEDNSITLAEWEQQSRTKKKPKKPKAKPAYASQEEVESLKKQVDQLSRKLDILIAALAPESQETPTERQEVL